ncbi:MAG: cytochrome C oxidase subunit I [Candidatus Dadabacteria bacterium]|nr:MAG: cytochrome C oxidase subunit I [Candidatus Dadabacteria bacterium]
MNTTAAVKGNFLEGEVRKCETTALPVCLKAEVFVKAHAVLAVVCILMGAIAGVSLGLTRWQAVHLLSPVWFYRALTFHGINMLIFWILFMEMAILYFAGTTLLNSRLFSSTLGWLNFILMVAGLILTDYIILTGRGDVLMTSYPPLQASPYFYLGIIIFAVGALIGVINFLLTVYIAWRDKTYGKTMPLVAFGALAAGIIAVFTLVHGAVALIPTYMWSMGWLSGVDPGWYRVTWWALGHPAQQVNLCAMVAVWYLLSTLTTGSKPINETVCRFAFLLYILFINLGSTHHLLVDPGLSAGWKIWNTSYAMYLAVLGSLIHAFTIPASVEVTMRKRGLGGGVLGWLANLPWRDPGFAAFILSFIIFGFIGGITGVTQGQEQINIIAHNTLRIPGHFHATVVGGTTLAFMGLTYYVVPLIFRREYPLKWLVRLQPYIFAVGVVIMSISMLLAGSYGVPRRHWDINFTGANIHATYPPIAYVLLTFVGIGAIIMFIGVLLYVLLTVAAVFFGRSNKGEVIDSWQGEGKAKEIQERLELAQKEDSETHHDTRGTMVLVLIFLATFVVYYFSNWKALSDVWYLR